MIHGKPAVGCWVERGEAQYTGQLTFRSTDWLLDLGPEGGEGGDKVVAEDPPEEVAKTQRKSEPRRGEAMDGPSNSSIMEHWHNSGRFPLDASMAISGCERRGRERLVRYSVRPPFAGKPLEWSDTGKIGDVAHL